jgi:hypothetical protein
LLVFKLLVVRLFLRGRADRGRILVILFPPCFSVIPSGAAAWHDGRSPPGINRITGGPRYWRASGEILRPRQERHQRKQWAIVLSLIKDERYGIEED